MKNLKKRILSFITAAAVAFASIGTLPGMGMLPGFDIPVFADELVEETYIDTWDIKHFNEYDPDVFEATETDGVKMVKLKKCIKVCDTIEINVDTVLDLNGFGIRCFWYDDYQCVIKVVNGASFTLMDSCTDKPVYGIKINDGRGCAVYKNGSQGIAVTGGYITGGALPVREWYEHNYDKNGGGVHVYNGTFTMLGGTIVGNMASEGGGVNVGGHDSDYSEVFLCTFIMKGGTICNNYGSTISGGVNVETYNKLILIGGTICDNLYGNGKVDDADICGDEEFYYRSVDYDKYPETDLLPIMIAAVTTNDGITADADEKFVIDTGDTKYFVENATVTLDNIPPDVSGVSVLKSDGSSVAAEKQPDGRYTFMMPADNVTVSMEYAHNGLPWDILQTVLDTASTDKNEPTEIALIQSFTAEDYDTALTVREGTYVSLDLNGFWLDRGLSRAEKRTDGNVINVEGTLEIYDSSTAQSGRITGGNRDGSGGGVYVSDGGKLTMSGVRITGNKADAGGGVYVAGGGELSVSGNVKIADNKRVTGTSETDDNVCLDDSVTLIVSGALGDTASVGVNRKNGGIFAVASDKYNGGKITAADKAHFMSDLPEFKVALTEDGKLTFAHEHNFRYSAEGDTITAVCSDDCPLADHKASITIVKPTLNIYGGTGSAAATITGTIPGVADPTVRYYRIDADGREISEKLPAAPTDAGKYRAEITIGTATAYVDYTIARKPITPTVEYSTETLTYDGTEKQLGVTAVRYGNVLLTADKDYTVSYSDNVNAGTDTASVIVKNTDNGNYTFGDVTRKFSIAQRGITVTAVNQKVTLGEDIVTDGADMVSVTSGELVTGHSITAAALTLADSADTNTLGEYDNAIVPTDVTIGCDTDDVTKNYKITFASGKLTVLVCAHKRTVLKNHIPETCLTGGYSGDLYCADCDALVEEGHATDPFGHDRKWTTTFEPTCTAAGEKSGVCSRCGDTVTEQIPALGHDIETVKVNETEPDCILDGGYITVEHCKRCGKVISLVTEVSPKLGHEFVNGVCTRCGAGEVKPGELSDKLGKAAGENVKIALTGDESAGKLTFPKADKAKEITIDGGGKTLAFNGAASVKPYQKTMLANITIKAEKGGKEQSITLTSAGGLTLENVTLDGKKSTVNAAKGDLTLGDITAKELDIKGSAKTALTVGGKVSAAKIGGFGKIYVEGELAVNKSLTVGELVLGEGALLTVADGASVTISKGISGNGTIRLSEEAKPISISGSINGKMTLTSDKPFAEGKQIFKSSLKDIGDRFDVSGIAPEVTDGTYEYGLYTKSGKVYIRAFRMRLGSSSFCEFSDIVNTIAKAKEKSRNYVIELLGDCNLGGSFRFPAKGTYAGLTINGGGHRITFKGKTLTLTGDLTLKDVTISSASGKWTVKTNGFGFTADLDRLINCTVK